MTTSFSLAACSLAGRGKRATVIFDLSSTHGRKASMKMLALVGLFSVVLFSVGAHAQGLGTIVGTVTDPTGASIPSARITVTQTGTSFSRATVSNPDGSFVVSSLSPAAYTLTTEAKGFSQARQSVTLLADQSLTINVKMQLGMENQVVEVAVDTVQVDT